MSNSDKFGAATAQAKEQASELAAQAKELADQLMTKAGPVVTETAARIGEYAVKAGEAIAGHVDGVAESVKSATSGKHADKIDAVGAKLKLLLDPDRQEGDSAEHPPAS
jgi:hypothetical protein